MKINLYTPLLLPSFILLLYYQSAIADDFSDALQHLGTPCGKRGILEKNLCSEEVAKNEIDRIDNIVNQDNISCLVSDEILIELLLRKGRCLDLVFYEPRRAENAFLSAVEKNPQRADTYAQIGDFYKRERRFDKAESYIDKALSIDQGVAEYHAIKGEILYLDYNFSGAIESFDEAIELNPSEGFYFFMRSKSLAPVTGLSFAKSAKMREDKEKALALGYSHDKERPGWLPNKRF